MDTPTAASASPLTTRMKRVTVGEMFRLAHGYLRETGAAPGPGAASVPFVVVPQLRACVRLDPASVQLYFDHVHPRRSWRTGATRALLSAAARTLRVRSALFRGPVGRALGSPFVYDPAGDLPHVDWAAVDVLLAEWQFVGVFSASAGTVSHVLTDDKYERCLENEVAARESLGPWVSLPPVLRASRTGPAKGWTEPFLLNEVALDERRDPFLELQAMLCVAYAATGEEADAAGYLDGLDRRAEALYPAEPGAAESVGRPLRQLLRSVRAQVAEHGVGTLPLARCHGDLSFGQVLSAGGQTALIDWSESEIAVAFHDYVYAALWHHGWRDFASPIAVRDLRVMRSGLWEVLQRVPPLLAVGLVLAEVALKQHVDYNERRGTVKMWGRLAEHYAQFSSAPAPARA